MYVINMTVIAIVTIKSGSEQIRRKKVEKHNLLVVQKYYTGFKVVEEPKL